MTQAEKITKLLDTVPATELGIIFMGNEPRLIGKMSDTKDMQFIKRVVDTLMISEHLSAERISRAKIESTGRTFIAAHN